ncbi:MAG: hypothetical protein ACRD15_20875 [Vicinamibacterales bacterium]
MARNLFAVMFCLVSASAFAAEPQDAHLLMRNYNASEVADGKIQVSLSGDIAYVSGTSADGPWLDVWRRTEGRWKMIGELAMREIAPIRFGVKRSRRCIS